MITQRGDDLLPLSQQQAVLLVFLRPFGCIFCTEAMIDLANQREYITSQGVRICCVHMADPEVAEGFFKQYNLEGIDHISDPDCKYYEAFGLLKGNFNQLYGLKVWLRTAQIAMKELRRLRMKQIGDGFQMPGVFLLNRGNISQEYRHRTTSDRPDYRRIIAKGLEVTG